MPSLQAHSVLEIQLLALLDRYGFGALPLEEQEQLFPEFSKQALLRISAAIVPELTPDGVNQFNALLDKKNTSEEDWKDFWNKFVPEAPEIIEQTLQKYAQELEEVFNK
jgi:hypothetical protein